MSINQINSSSYTSVNTAPTHDPQYTDFQNAEEAFEQALKNAQADPSTANIVLLQMAAKNLSAAETALKATGVTEDTNMATTYDALIGTNVANIMSGDATKIRNQLDQWGPGGSQQGEWADLVNNFATFDQVFPKN